MLTQSRALVVLSAGPILSHFTNLLGMSFSLLLHFLAVLSLETSVCSFLKLCSVFLGSC